MSERIGILGGAFNPPHFAHLRTALDTLEYLGLDRLLLLPAGNHPFKGAKVLAPAVHRLAMTRLAVAGESRFEVCPLEAEATGTSYTFETLATLAAQQPEAERFFLIGADLLGELHLWRKWERLLDHAHLCVMTRPGSERLITEAKAIRKLADRQVARPEKLSSLRHGILIAPVTPLTISSSDIRQRLTQGRSIRYLVPDAVEEYIRAHRLYREG